MNRRRDDTYQYHSLPLAYPSSARGVLQQPVPHHQQSSSQHQPQQQHRLLSGKASGTWAEEWVDELTKALPMRAAFYHHVAFSVLTSQLPRLDFDLCEPIPSGPSSSPTFSFLILIY
jgi:hypothetical protein